jgi:hypothetical protein
MVRKRWERKKLLVALSFAAAIALLLIRCGKKKESTGGVGVGGQQEPPETKFTSPDDAATKTFGNFSAGPASSGILTARIITARMITGRAPAFIPISKILNQPEEIMRARLSKKQSNGNFEIDISCGKGFEPPECRDGGKIDKYDCKEGQDGQKKWINFEVKVSDCKEVASDGSYTVASGYMKGYIEIVSRFSQDGSEIAFSYAIEEADLTISEFSGNQMKAGVRTTASGFKTELKTSSANGLVKTSFLLSGSYSNEDLVNKRKEAYSFYDFVSEATSQFAEDSPSLIYISISGKYSVDTTPDVDCIEGVFNFKTIEPLRQDIELIVEPAGSGSSVGGLCRLVGKIQVNNAIFEFSSSEIKVKVDEQTKTYSCDKVGEQCSYKPIESEILMPMLEMVGGEQQQPIKEQQKMSGVVVYKIGEIFRVQPNNRMSSLILQGKYDTIRREFCGDNGCADELKNFSNKVTVSLVITFTNSMILAQRLDKALTTLCGFAASSLPPQICGVGSAPVRQTSRISEKQTDMVDTILNLVGLNRNEITTLMMESATATENYIKISDSKNYAFAITVPFQVKVGNLVDIWFKAGTEIRWDFVNILGGVSQLGLAGFNVINSHDFVLDIGAILSNANQLLSDLQGDPAGFVVRLPGTLGLDGAPNFLRFKQGGADIWKQIPTNFSKAFGWSGQGLEYMFVNPCKDNDPALVCYKDGKLRLNLDLQKENKFMGKATTGELALPGGFASETAQNLVKALKNGGEKFDCSKSDNEIHISEGPDKFDISKIVNISGLFMTSRITEVSLPDFAKIDVCKFFGAEGTQPKPIRDLLFPYELVQDGVGYKTANAGKFFAVEFEASRNFFLKAITSGNNQDNPIYLSRWTNYGDLIVVTNAPTYLTGGLPYLPSAAVIFESGATTIYIKFSSPTYVLSTPSQYQSIIIEHRIADFLNFAPLLFDSSSPNKYGLLGSTIGLLVSKNWVKGDYVARGDGKRFSKVKDRNGNSLEILQDYLDPLTSFISLRWNSQYPQDVVSSLSAILDDIGMRFLIYVLFKDPSWNNSVQIDICSILYAFASAAKQRYDAVITTNLLRAQALLNILYALFRLQNDRASLWGCSVISVVGAVFNVSQPYPTWRTSSNQLMNDLISISSFAIAGASGQ